MAWDLQQCGMCDQQRLRSAGAYPQTDQSLCLSLEYSVSVKLLTKHHLEFLSLNGGCTGWSESTLVKMPHCWKSHVTAHLCLISYLSFVTDGDEPLMSGSGVVSKEITDENLLEAWRDVLKKWHQNLGQKPKQVHQLARKSIPEALRGEVWQLLAGCQNSQDLLEAYRILMTKVRYCLILLLYSVKFEQASLGVYNVVKEYQTV